MTQPGDVVTCYGDSDRSAAEYGERSAMMPPCSPVATATRLVLKLVANSATHDACGNRAGLSTDSAILGKALDTSVPSDNGLSQTERAYIPASVCVSVTGPKRI